MRQWLERCGIGVCLLAALWGSWTQANSPSNFWEWLPEFMGYACLFMAFGGGILIFEDQPTHPKRRK